MGIIISPLQGYRRDLLFVDGAIAPFSPTFCLTVAFFVTIVCVEWIGLEGYISLYIIISTNKLFRNLSWAYYLCHPPSSPHQEISLLKWILKSRRPFKCSQFPDSVSLLHRLFLVIRKRPILHRRNYSKQIMYDSWIITVRSKLKSQFS